MNDNDSLIERLNKLINEANERQTIAIKENIQVEVSEVKLEINELKKSIERQKTKINTLVEIQTDLQIKYKTLQKSLRKNNIVIFGAEIEDRQKSLDEYIIQKINQWLELDLTVDCLDNVYFLGKSGINRPVLVKLQSYLTKVRILRECKKLRGTKISISEDLTKAERDELKALIRYKKIAQNEGHKAYIKNNSLYINNEKYTLEKLQREDREAEESKVQRDHEQENIDSCSNTPTVEEIEDSDEDSDEDCVDSEPNVNRNRRRNENIIEVGENTRKNGEDTLKKKLKSTTLHADVNKQKGKTNQKFVTKTKKKHTRAGK